MLKKISKFFGQLYSSMLTSIFYPFQLDKSRCKIEDAKKEDKIKDIKETDKKNHKF